MTVYVGGLRARLVHDSVYRMLYDALDLLGWFTPSVTHSPVTFISEPLAPDVQVPLNTLGLADEDDGGEEIELGSTLQELRWQMYLDFFGENDAISLHLIRDVKDILQGRMASAGRTRSIVVVNDYTLATPVPIFTVDIEDVFTDKARDFPQPWLRSWRTCGFTVVDTYSDEEDVYVPPEALSIYIPTGDDSFYIHEQTTPSALWVITHNLGYQPGGIEVTDSGGDSVEGDVTFVNANVLTIAFGAAFAGTAFLS